MFGRANYCGRGPAIWGNWKLLDTGPFSLKTPKVQNFQSWDVLSRFHGFCTKQEFQRKALEELGSVQKKDFDQKPLKYSKISILVTVHHAVCKVILQSVQQVARISARVHYHSSHTENDVPLLGRVDNVMLTWIICKTWLRLGGKTDST